MRGQPLHRLLQGLLQEASPAEWVAACTALLCIVQYGLLPRDVFFAPDEGMRVIVSRTLRPESIFTGMIRYENQPVDPRIEFAPYFEQWFSIAPGPELRVSYPIVWFAALIAPLYALGGVALAQAFPLLCGVLTGLFASRILYQIAGRGAATLGVVAVMLAIPSAVYSFLLWEHQLALALCLLALACYVEYETRRRVFALGVGAAAATLACALRVETLFVVAPVLLAVGWHQFSAAQAPVRRRVGIVGAVALAGGLLGGLYWFIVRDTPYRLPVLAPALSPAQLQRMGVQVMRVFVGYDASPATGAALLGVLVIGAAALMAWRRDSLRCAGIAAGVLIAAALITTLSILRIEPFRVVNPGLLCGAPLLVVAILPAGDTRLPLLRRALVMIFIGFAVGAFLTPRLASRAGGVMAQIGSTWGSRYFLALYPLMAIAALASLMSWMRAIRQTGESAMQDKPRLRPASVASVTVLSVGVALALATGILVNVIGLTRIHADKNIVLSGCWTAWQTQANVLVTDDWWRAPECAARAQPMYLLARQSDVLPRLTQALYQANVSRLAYASQTGRLSADMLTANLERCFVVMRDEPASQFVTTLSLTPRAVTCAD